MAINIGYFEFILMMLLLIFDFGNSTSSESDAHVLCLGQPQTFLCEVQKQGSLIFRLQWRVSFVSSPPVPRITRRFTADDPEGLILKDSTSGINFEFNLTSNSNLSSLTSIMTVTVEDINGTSFDNATLECEGDEAHPITLQVNKGPLPVHTYFTHDQDNVTILWSPNDNDRVDYYIISVTTNTIEISFTTSNTSIQLPLQYNQEYNISVIANNCAGNSTPTEMSLRIGCCTFLSTGSMVYIHTENNSSQLMTCAKEGLYAYSCQPGLVPSEARMVHCRRDGTWSPNPHDLDCHHLMTETYATISPTLGTEAGDLILIPSLIVSLLVFAIITFILGILFGILLVKYIPKSSKKNDNVIQPESGSVPLYEEIKPGSGSPVMDQNSVKLKDNEAYGHNIGF